MNKERVTTGDGTFTYDWQKSKEFLKWLLPTVLGALDHDDPGYIEVYESLVERTNRWTSVELRLTVNGVKVSTRSFLAGVEGAVEHAATAAATRWIRSQAELSQMLDALGKLQRLASERLTTLARNAGLELPEDD